MFVIVIFQLFIFFGNYFIYSFLYMIQIIVDFLSGSRI